MGQALWKRQQRSSAFKWIKTRAQSPGPACIGQTGCSLDEDLRLIISHAAFVFAATVAYRGTAEQFMLGCTYFVGRERLASELPKLRSFLLFVFLIRIFFYNICAQFLFAEFQPEVTLAVTNYALVERFLSSECIPTECLCLVCRHAIPSYLRYKVWAPVMVLPSTWCVSPPCFLRCVSTN